MMDGPLVFVDVDTQRDFMEADGALPVPSAAQIVPNLERLTAYARRHGVPVVATADAHTEADVEEIARFGRHCMAGTPGRSRIAATAWPDGMVLAADGHLAPGTDALPQHLTIEKRHFDVFTHPEASRIAALHDRTRPTFVVYGVATDFCVRAAVLGLLRLGCKVAVVADAVRPIDEAHEPEVFAEMTNAGAVLTLTEAVCDDHADHPAVGTSSASG